MYKNTIKLVTSGVILALVSACSSSPDDEFSQVPNKPAQELYADAKESLNNGIYSKAIQELTALDSRYPFGPFSHQAQLDLIYAHYKSGDTAQARATIDRFTRLNPNHPDTDYVYYMRGLTNLAEDENLFQDMFGIDRADRDPTYTKEAFNDFRQVVEQYPDSKYATDARKRMLYARDRLAKYEMKVAEFYIRRGAYVAASNRARYILEYYKGTSEIEYALEVLVECYTELGLDDLKKDALSVLKLNYPDNDLVK